MLEAVELFRDRDTVDELGLGSVRDAFSDLLFPGTSVLHTRARYLLFIPWIYRDLERRKVASAHAGSIARRDEVRLIEALRRGQPDSQGIIGVQAGARLQRLPSSAYWQGLHRLGVRLFAGSQDRYHRSLDAYYVGRRRFRDLQQSVQGEDSELVERQPSNWHPGIPPAPDGLLEEASFELGQDEAAYLRDRILLQAPRTLLSALVDRADALVGVAHPWSHPAHADFDPQLAERIEYARRFSDLMQGGQLLYGHLLAEMIGGEGPNPYRERLDEWEVSRARLADRAANTDRQRFWAVVRDGNARVPHPTQRFIDRWWDVVVDEATPVADSPIATTLVTERERFLKRGLARLDESNVRAREMWGGTAGLNQLDYRWSTVRQLLQDIQTGLSRDAGA